MRLGLEYAKMTPSERMAFMDSLSGEEANALIYDWELWARPKQLVPEGDWFGWLNLAGRGYGKTRVGTETVRKWVEKARDDAGFTDILRIALVAETAADARDVLIEGESGILKNAPPWLMPEYTPSLRKVTWFYEDGRVLAEALTFSGQKPEQLRGPQFHKAWCDELAKYQYPQETWDNLELALRLGREPQVVITTTPKPIPIIVKLNKDEDVVVTSGSSYENLANLAPRYIRRVIKKYEGTRIGEQELHARILEDAPGAFWTTALLENSRAVRPRQFKRIVVGVDPSMTSGEDADECGITVGGLGLDDVAYLLNDGSGQFGPTEWAKKVVNKYHNFEADLVVGEVNNGGELVQINIGTVEPNIPFKMVHATRGKHIRAEPVAALYEQGKIKHCGVFGDLEDQLKGFNRDGYTGPSSPDRADSWVWVVTELMLGGGTWSTDADDYEDSRR